MRKFGLICAILMPFISYCNTYFGEGTKWVTQIISTDRPEPQYFYEYYELRNDAESDCFKLYKSDDNFQSNSNLAFYVKVENEKVYFSPLTNQSWYLFYDFSLKKGEGAYFYSPSTHNTSNQFSKSYIKCKELTESSEPDHRIILTLDEYSDETCMQFLGTGRWIYGLGSASGLLENILFERDGTGSRLWKVTTPEETVYSFESARINKLNDSEDINVTIGNDTLIIDSDKNGYAFLYDLSGKLIEKISIINGRNPLQKPPKGIYLLKINDTSFKLNI